jgi:hypothetical protein
MIETDSHDPALSTLHSGQRIEVLDDRVLCCRGLVEEFVPR